MPCKLAVETSVRLLDFCQHTKLSGILLPAVSLLCEGDTTWKYLLLGVISGAAAPGTASFTKPWHACAYAWTALALSFGML